MNSTISTNNTKTRGAWAKENWKEWEKEEKKKRKIELKASQRRQNQTW